MEAACHGCYHNDKKPVHLMAKTVIRHAAREDFETLLAIDEAIFPGGEAYDANELAYFMSRNGAETIVAEAVGEVNSCLIIEVHMTMRTAIIVTHVFRET